MLLPILMWVVAALLSWYLVRRSLIQPLARLTSAVTAYQPGDTLELPEKLGPAAEIRELGQAFERAVARIEESERHMGEALRASADWSARSITALRIICRSWLRCSTSTAVARKAEARAAYAAIGRRVDALPSSIETISPRSRKLAALRCGSAR